jgi:hypothetical protein
MNKKATLFCTLVTSCSLIPWALQIWLLGGDLREVYRVVKGVIELPFPALFTPLRRRTSFAAGWIRFDSMSHTSELIQDGGNSSRFAYNCGHIKVPCLHLLHSKLGAYNCW